MKVTDTFCICHAGTRVIGGRIHALAVLIFFDKLLDNIARREPTRSQEMLRRGLVLLREDDVDSDISESDTR